MERQGGIMFIKKYLSSCKMQKGVVHYIYRFPDNHGLSIIKDSGLSESWDIAIIKFTRDNHEIVYDTPLTGSTGTFCTKEQINDFIEEAIELFT